MPTSEARIRANQLNAARSKGPTTEEGKARSRANSLKHGMTGAGVVLPDEDADEVERRFAAFEDELRPTGELGRELVRRAAVCSVRMGRAVSQETAALSDRVRQAEADFVAPEGIDPSTAARLRAEACARAMFDPSKDAALARKYEAAAERGFFRALKEFRQIERQAKAADPVAEAEAHREELGSFLPVKAVAAEWKALGLDRALIPPTRPSSRVEPDYFPAIGGGVDVPITIGRRR